MISHLNILQAILEKSKTWFDIKTELSKFNIHDVTLGLKDSSAGKIFEIFTKYYFKSSPSEKENFKNVWLFEEVPSDIREKLNLGKIDYGVDLVLEDTEGLFFVVQCKFRNDESAKLNWTADKIANLFAYCPNANGYIVFSNASGLDEVSKTRYENFTFFSNVNLLEMDSETIRLIYEEIANKKEVKRCFLTPRAHQQLAIQDCVNEFKVENRGQLILPCGAGKTLTALWIKESLASRNTLVLVPSLALLRQIKLEWNRQRKTSYKYICVCSELDIDELHFDTQVTHTYEIDVHVTTNPEQIKTFLLKDYEHKVIFSTYHSLHAIENAMIGIDVEFDFVFCDEAHKTAGVGNNRFSLIHDNTKIPAKRRLYATATPRIVKKKLGEELKYSFDMNDPKIFGKEFHRMSFKDAIEAGILVDYQIIAVGVSNEEIKNSIDNRHFIENQLTIDEIANNYALEHVMLKYQANHAITFHSRVKLADKFSQRHSKLFPNVKALTVNGNQTTNTRNIVLEEFKKSTKAIISNARCLTEGVDVPTIDMVYFCDPKNSKIDIVQAVGRALRRSEGKAKGYIVIPVYHTKHDNVETSINDSAFKNLLQVIRSLCEHDERLQCEINLLAMGKGKRLLRRIECTNADFIEEKDIILLDGFEEKLKESLFTQIIEKSTNNWDLWLLRLQNHLNANNGQYPTKENNIELYRWVAQQRTKKSNNSLSNEEIRKLNEIDFVWAAIDIKWDELFTQLVQFRKNNPDKWPLYDRQNIDNPENQIAIFCQTLRKQYRTHNLEDRWINQLDDINFNFNGKTDNWLNYYEKVKKSINKHNSISISSIGQNANSWILRQKRLMEQGKLPKYQYKKIEELDLDKYFQSWEDIFIKVKKWVVDNKKIPTRIDEKNYNSWLSSQRVRFKNGYLTDEQINKLNSIGFDLEGKGKEVKERKWFVQLETYKKFIEENRREPSCYGNDEEKTIYNWAATQRAVNSGIAPRRKPLTPKRKAALDAIGFKWNGIVDEKWDNIKELIKYKCADGKIIIPTNINGNRNPLYNWWYYYKRSFKDGKLGGEQMKKFLEAGIDLSK